MEHEILRKQIMVNQFCNQVGCTPEQATEILQNARWQIEVAFSLYFQGHAIVTQTSTVSGAPGHHDGPTSMDSSGGNSFGSRKSYSCVPTNTPATPPSLPDTLAAFAQMKASSPDQRAGLETRVVHLQASGKS